MKGDTTAGECVEISWQSSPWSLTQSADSKQRMFWGVGRVGALRRQDVAGAASLPDSIDQTSIDLSVGIDSAISQEWPMCALLIDASPIDFRRHDLLMIDRTFRDDFAVRPAHEALTPKFNAISAGRHLVANPVCHRDVASIGDRMTTLNRLPSGMLRFSKFLFLARMPADCRWIKNNLCSAQGSQSCGFRIPLIPANTDADLARLSIPRSKSEIARREVKLFVIQRIIGNMHFAIFT